MCSTHIGQGWIDQGVLTRGGGGEGKINLLEIQERGSLQRVCVPKDMFLSNCLVNLSLPQTAWIHLKLILLISDDVSA